MTSSPSKMRAHAIPFLTVLASLLTTTIAQQSGTGTTTRYWDCCKPSCAWNDLSTLGIESAVVSCDINDNPLASTSIQSACDSGTAFMCSSQVPWAVSSTLAYGFAAVSSSANECCQCYQLTFTSTALVGKTMIVQATNTGGDVAQTQFDLAMPGGGFGIFDGCGQEWGATSAIWGAQYGGSSTDTCPQFPTKLQAGCNFRWGWFEGADNPTVQWQTVACPAALTELSGCVRIGDTPTGPPSVPTYTGGTGPSSTGSSTSTKTSTSASSTPTPPTGPSGCTSAEYGQCGGIGWTGCTACAAGTTCQVGNAYYSQCLP